MRFYVLYKFFNFCDIIFFHLNLFFGNFSKCYLIAIFEFCYRIKLFSLVRYFTIGLTCKRRVLRSLNFFILKLLSCFNGTHKSTLGLRICFVRYATFFSLNMGGQAIEDILNNSDFDFSAKKNSGESEREEISKKRDNTTKILKK